MTSFLNEKELKKIGLKIFGKNVLISKKASIYNPELIEIGNNVRIDDFCILSGNIALGNCIHIAAGCFLYGSKIGIEMHDFCGLSSRVCIYTSTDDYSGENLTNPTIPLNYRKIQEDKVTLQKHVIIGTGSTILPGVTIGEGAAVGAMSLVTKNVEPWTIVFGIPAKFLKNRKKDLLMVEKEFLKKYNFYFDKSFHI